MEFARQQLIVHFIGLEPIEFDSNRDGIDLVQNLLIKQLVRSDKDILGQDGTLSIDDQQQFLSFKARDTRNRSFNVPIEYLAFCSAVRRMKMKSPADQREADFIERRHFENLHLANRYAHLIQGPPIFVAVFHGFDRSLCYTFVTQSSDDACLLVTRLMRAFKSIEAKSETQQVDVVRSTPIYCLNVSTLFSCDNELWIVSSVNRNQLEIKKKWILSFDASIGFVIRPIESMSDR